MRVARIITNETCNQRCRFCTTRRDSERASVASGSAVRARIDEAVTEGAVVAVLTGGEPSKRGDLVGVVQHVRQSGIRQVVLETNGSLIDDAMAKALRTAGLGTARIRLPMWGDGLDAITEERGGFAATRRAMAAIAAEGVELEVVTPIVRANAEEVSLLPQALHDSGLPIGRLLVRVPAQSPDPSELLGMAQAASIVEAVARAARGVGLTMQFDPDAMLPPCTFPNPNRVAHLYALTAGGGSRDGYGHVDACRGCSVEDRCPGVPVSALAREPDFAVSPIEGDRIRRRLTVISSVEEQITRELVTREIYRRPDGTSVAAHIVRINFHCNQGCRFCFVSTHLPPPAPEQILAAIDEVAAIGGVLVVSGGEPTLNPRLSEYVRRGKANGASEVELQTNATRLADASMVDELVEAGLDVAFVSLHGSHATLSDSITDAPGTFEETVVGLDALVRSGVHVRVNFVLCTKNYEDFPDFVALVATRWPRAAITVSFVGGSTDLVPRTPDLIPRYSDVLPSLTEGLTRARAHGLEVGGFESMCGIPLCLVPQDLEPYLGLAEIPEGYARGELIKPEPCGQCTLAGRCFGLRRGYAEMYGIDELRPVGSGRSSP